MNRLQRRIFAAAVATGLAGLAAAALVTGPIADPTPESAAPWLCIDLSEIELPSICVG